MSTFLRYYPGMNLIAQSYTAQIFFLLSKQPARFSAVCVRCSSDLPIKPDSTSGICDNLIAPIIRKASSQVTTGSLSLLCLLGFLCRGTSDPGYEIWCLFLISNRKPGEIKFFSKLATMVM